MATSFNVSLFQALQTVFQPGNLNFLLLSKPTLLKILDDFSKWKNLLSFDYFFFQNVYYITVSLTVSCRFTGKIRFIRFTDGFLFMLQVTVTCIEFFLTTFMRMCLCCRKTYTTDFPPNQTISNVLHIFSHCSYIFPTWAFVYSWNKLFIWQLPLCWSIFLDFNLIPTANKAVDLGE